MGEGTQGRGGGGRRKEGRRKCAVSRVICGFDPQGVGTLCGQQPCHLVRDEESPPRPDALLAEMWWR